VAVENIFLFDLLDVEYLISHSSLKTKSKILGTFAKKKLK